MKENKQNKQNKQKGGDGYTINVNQAIGGLPAFSRYSNNYSPVFVGELLQNGGKRGKNCGCEKSKKNESIYDLIKLQGGNKNKNNKISQFEAIREVSKQLTPLKTNSLKKLITKLFMHDLTKTRKFNIINRQLGGYSTQFQNIIAPLGRNNLLVIASLLLLHHFAVESIKNKKINKRKTGKRRKTRKIMRGGAFTDSLGKLLAPTGINSLGATLLLVGLREAFMQKKGKKLMGGGGSKKNIKGGSALKDLIAPLGTNAFVATGLLIVLKNLFTKKMNEINTRDLKKKKLIGGQIKKKRDELFNLVAPITFNTFATKSLLQKFIPKK